MNAIGKEARAVAMHWQLEFWQTGCAELFRAIGFSLVALALGRLFREKQTEVLGRHRWAVVALSLLIALLQVAMFGAWSAGRLELARVIGLGAAACMLAIAISAWPFLAYVKARLNQAMDANIERRLKQAEAQAAETMRLMVLAEEVAHLGHWRISLPDRRVFWSDEIFRIHGLAVSSYAPEFDTAIAAFHPDDQTMVTATVEHAVRDGASYQFTARLIQPDGQIRHVLSRGQMETDDHGAPTGIFGVLLDVTEQKLTEEKLIAANQAAAKANQALAELALVDSLTGLPNRRQFDAALDMEFKRAIREGTPLGLIMVDLDYFKAYNDIYGHPAGDDCLREVTAAIAAVPQRPGDLAARYGGEEIVLLLPGADESGAALLAKRLVEAVRALEIPHRGALGQVTISCGVAVFHPRVDDWTEPVRLVQGADRALYKAKQGGRDRVCRLGAPELREAVTLTH